MRLKELAELQEKYSHLERTKMTKKSLCDLIIPFRDKYALTDGQALRVARREFTLNQIEKLMKVCSMKPVWICSKRWATLSMVKVIWLTGDAAFSKVKTTIRK